MNSRNARRCSPAHRLAASVLALLACWHLAGGAGLVRAGPLGGARPERDPFSLLANYFSQNGRSALSRDLVKSAHELALRVGLAQTDQKLATLFGARTSEVAAPNKRRELDRLIGDLAQMRHFEQVDSAEEFCATANLARIRSLAEAMLASYKFQLRTQSDCGKFLLERPASLVRAVGELAEQAESVCLPELRREDPQARTFYAELEASFGEYLAELDSIAFEETRRDYSLQLEQQVACENFDLPGQRALAKRVKRDGLEFDQAALAELQVALGKIHARRARTDGKLERLDRKTGRSLRMTRDDFANYLRAYLLEPCLEFMSERQVSERIRPASEIFVSDLAKSITRKPARWSLVAADRASPQLTWTLRYFMCERLTRADGSRLVKQLMGAKQ